MNRYPIHTAAKNAAVGMAGRRRVPICVMVSLIESVPESGRGRANSSPACLPVGPSNAPRCALWFRHPTFQSAHAGQELACPLARFTYPAQEAVGGYPFSEIGCQ